MAEAKKSVFSILAKPIRRAIQDRGFYEPTEPQAKAIPLIMKDKNVLLIAPTGTGKCVSRDTLVFTDRGPIEIGKLCGQLVRVNALNEELKVALELGMVIRKRKSRLYKVKTRTGRSVKVTDDHRFLTIKNGRPMWRELRSIKIGEYIALARRLELVEREDAKLTFDHFKEWLNQLTMRIDPPLPELLKKLATERQTGMARIARILKCSKVTLLAAKKGARISASIISRLLDLMGIPYDSVKVVEVGVMGGKAIIVPKVDEELARFTGLMIGDGNINQYRIVRFATSSPEKLEFVRRYIKSLGLKLKKDKSKKYDYYISSKPLAIILYALGLPKKSKSARVKIPEMFFTKSTLLSSVLGGIYDTDGYVFRNEIELMTKSKSLANGVLIALLCFGIFAILKEKRVGRRRYFRVVIRSVADRRRFNAYIGFDDLKKTEKLRVTLGVKSNPNLDLVPNIAHPLRACKDDMNVKWSHDRAYKLYESYVMPSARSPSKQSLLQVLDYFRENSRTLRTGERFDELRRLATSDVFWDKIVEIKRLKEDYVFDATVPGAGNFIGNGMVLHNTEAAFLPILDFILKLEEKKLGIKALYITPLRALNRDLLERLEWWCKRLDLRLSVRHGDTELKERSAQARFPPDILITTPETLQAILPGRVMRRHLKSIRWVIVDEVHELATEKRGSQLALGLERLRYITEIDFQMIGLSATIGTPKEVSKFLVGKDRPCEIVQVPVSRFIQLNIIYPKPIAEDFELASKLYTYPEVASRLRVMRNLIEENASVLLFTNTRSEAEVLASRFRVWEINLPIGVHHGSLSRVSRMSAERGLKEGKLSGIVCTSSLELGIDVGVLEMVIQYNSPRQVTRLLQRVGRSGHKVGGIAKGVIITQDPDDALEALVIARRALIEKLEPAPIPDKPLDAITHQIVGLMMQKGRWSFEEVLGIFKKAYSYRDLSEDDLKKVLDYMHTRYPRFAWTSFQDKFFIKPQRIKELYEYYFQNLSMIPDEKQFIVIEEEKDEPIGVLDEAFVAEHGEIGTKFIVRGSIWKILQVFRDRIYVKSEDDITGAIPSWVGEEIPVPFEVANEVGEIRRKVEEMLGLGSKPEDITLELSKIYPCDSQTIMLAISEILDQFKMKIPIPTDKRITIEQWEDFIIINCCFGLLVNRTISRILGLILSEKIGLPIKIQQDPYRIIIQTDKVRPDDISSMLKELVHKDIKEMATQAFIRTGIFKRRFLHVARKFGAISKDVDLSDVNLSNLMKGFEGTVIFDEAIRTVLFDDADIELTNFIINKIASGDIEISLIKNLDSITPIARIGIEEMGRMRDIIPPQRMKNILIRSAHARLFNESRVFVCTNCWNYSEILRVIDLKEDIICPRCCSSKIGLADEPLEKMLSLCDKMLSKKESSDKEKMMLRKVVNSAELISNYGLAAVLVMVAKGISLSEATILLREEPKMNDRLIELIIEAERRALKRRFFI